MRALTCTIVIQYHIDPLCVTHTNNLGDTMMPSDLECLGTTVSSAYQ